MLLPLERLEQPRRRRKPCRRGGASSQFWRERTRFTRVEFELKQSTKNSLSTPLFFLVTFDHFSLSLFFLLTSAAAAVSKKKKTKNGHLHPRRRSLQHQPPRADRDPRRRQALEQAPRSVSERMKRGRTEERTEKAREREARQHRRRRSPKRRNGPSFSTKTASGSRCSTESPSKSTRRSGTGSG